MTTFLSIFQSQVQINPNAKALVYKDLCVDYARLYQLVKQTASMLKQEYDNGDFIGISAKRGPLSILGVLSILARGKAYLPLDAKWPLSRLEEIIRNAGITTVVCSEAENEFFQKLGLGTVNPSLELGSDNEDVEIGIGNLTYVLHTSGSTGKPKGVVMGTNALTNLIQWQATDSAAKVGTYTLQFSPLTFDVSFQEIFSTLTTGGTLVLADEEVLHDPQTLVQLLIEQKVNRLFLPFVALQLLAESALAFQAIPTDLEEIITAGEQLKITDSLVRFFEQLPHCKLVNQYGPTEAHVVSALTLTGKPSEWPALPSIGKAIAGVNLYCVDSEGNVVKPGEQGELHITGLALAEEYLNSESLTSEKFNQLQLPNGEVVRAYRTGDIAYHDSDGNIQFLGRADDQVKIAGYRIEPAEIEVYLAKIEGVKEVAVVPFQQADQLQLAAFYTGAALDSQIIKDELGKHLPYYMVPAYIFHKAELAKTSSGKIDRKSLSEWATAQFLNLNTSKIKAENLSQKVAQAFETILNRADLPADSHFFDWGGSSLLAMRLVALLKAEYDIQLSVMKLYQYPKLNALIAYLEGNSVENKPKNKAKVLTLNSDSEVAIIAMAGRFPGADTLEGFWDILSQNKETTTFWKKEELDAHLDIALIQNADYVPARGIVNSAKHFDAAFFGLNPAVAELMDPQQRVFLEICYEALEQAGHLPHNYDGTVGVYAGCGNNTYYQHNVLSNTDLVERLGEFQVMTLNEKDYVATRVSYVLNLNGPGVSVHSGCSTSALAIAQAVDAIRNGRCEVALAGGVAITSPMESGHLYQEGAIYSIDGHCKPFSSEATGTVFSDGAGVLLLKSKSAAIADGDTILAVIKGVGTSNDGNNKAGFTAPSASGQAAAITNALTDAGVKPEQISYIEAHGTATPIGDPVEIEGLKLAFGEPSSSQFCGIGSVKSNFGHLTAAAGVAGIMKTVLALQHKHIPASLHVGQVNPLLALEDSPFYVVGKNQGWQSETKRLAGVSSFGVGGTNVHVILEEAEPIDIQEVVSESPSYLLPFSAKSGESNQLYARKLAEFIERNPQLSLASVSASLLLNKPNNTVRCFITAANHSEAIEKLRVESIAVKSVSTKSQEVVFSFPGQGSQFPTMGKELYATLPVFKAAVDECIALAENEAGKPLFPILFPEKVTAENAEELNQTENAQIGIFIIGYALAKTWMQAGLKPSAFIGHSIGEFVAAHLAGVLSLENAIKIVIARGKLMAEMPKGSMLAIRAKHTEIAPTLPAHLSVAAVNSPDLFVVAGETADIEIYAQHLESKGISAKKLQTSHAFHSAMMDAAVPPFLAVIQEIGLHKPQLPICSTVTGTWLKDREATDPQYWATHLRNTVLFSTAAEKLLTDFQAEGNQVISLECGPGNVSSTLLMQHAKTYQNIAFSVLDANKTNVFESYLQALGGLWLQGIALDWMNAIPALPAQKIALPTYAFNRKPCWVYPPSKSAEKAQAISHVATAPVVTKIQNVSVQQEVAAKPIIRTGNSSNQKERLLLQVLEILEDATGLGFDLSQVSSGFIELGLDSLLLTQLALRFKKEYGLPITFRQLNEQLDSPEKLANYLLKELSAEAIANIAPDEYEEEIQTESVQVAVPDGAMGMVLQQLQALTQQVLALQGGGSVPQQVHSSHSQVQVAPTKKLKIAEKSDTADVTKEELLELKKPFGATARIDKQSAELNPKQKAFLEAMIIRYNNKTRSSKSYTEKHRDHMADPRVVSGFKPAVKEMVYPIVVNKSEGARVWDIDGNEYVDALNGFGSNFFGYNHPHILKALQQQLANGVEVGPQHELAGDVCKMICEFTNFDRAALCNTGSEAVLGAMRVARTVTGRPLIVAFNGSYHGIVDEVIVRGTSKLKSFAAAPGIMPEAVQNMLILDYGIEQSLDIIRNRADEIAAVMVEPVQSRRPEFQPIEFLKALRKLTEELDITLIFDEVITGFRTHQGGAQAIFGVQADLATYGKVIGGGMPIGAIAGKRAWMDALDGGGWQFGDDSIPEVGVTYFAGTFVRHPLALAGAKASLELMKEGGEGLHHEMQNKTQYLVTRMNKFIEKLGLPMYVATFGSLWKIKQKEPALPYVELFFTLMREKGVHIWDLFPCFLTTAHTYDDIEFIAEVFEESINELISAGFLKTIAEPGTTNRQRVKKASQPPVPGAKLGIDKEGKPAWFLPDPDRNGYFLQVLS